VSEEYVFLGLDDTTNFPIVFIIHRNEVQKVRTVKFTKCLVNATKWTKGYSFEQTFEELDEEDDEDLCSTKNR
jgi:hypothetical protein